MKLYMRATDLLKQYREGINPPYSARKRDFVAILGTLFILLAVPLTVILINQAREPKSKAQNTLVESKESLVKVQTLEILRLNQELKKSLNNSILKDQIGEMAKKRRINFATLIEENPNRALEIALPSNIIKSFPADVQDSFESNLTLEGPLEVLIADDFDKKISKTYYSINSGGQKYSIFSTQADSSLLSGTVVEVTGTTLDGKMAVSEENFKVKSKKNNVLAAATTKKVALILFNFQNNTQQPATVAEAKDAIFTGAGSLNAYYKEVSFGLLSLKGIVNADGDVFGWYTIPYDNTGCPYGTWRESAKNAAIASGADLNGYDNIIYYSPWASCGFSGIAPLGGNWLYVNFPYIYWGTFGHEFGHNLGLQHANGYLCYDASGQRTAISDNCTSYEYQDPYSIMGSLGNFHHNTIHKGQLGFYDASNTNTVTKSGTYVIDAVEKTGSGVKALRIPRTYGKGGVVIDYYYLEFRQKFPNFDNFQLTDSVVNGVSIRIGKDYSNTGVTNLLDTTPGTRNNAYKGQDDVIDGALAIGKTFTDSLKNISISALDKTTDTATVQVTLGRPKCARSNPSLSLTPQNQWAAAGQSVTYTLTLTNNDSIECSSSKYNLTSLLPSGLSQSPSTLTKTLSPGQSITEIINVTSTEGTPVGFYSVKESVVNSRFPSLSASVVANYNAFVP